MSIFGSKDDKEMEKMDPERRDFISNLRGQVSPKAFENKIDMNDIQKKLSLIYNTNKDEKSK